MTPLLACENLTGGYGDLPIIHDIDLAYDVILRIGDAELISG